MYFFLASRYIHRETSLSMQDVGKSGTEDLELEVC
jgi:hypothetical protein